MKKELINKVITIVITFSTVAVLAACGGSKSLPSSKAQSCAKKAISAGQNYLDGSESYDSVQDAIDEIKEDLEYLHDSDDADRNENHTQDLSVEKDVLLLSSAILDDNFEGTSETYEKVEGCIKDLKEDIGE